MEPKTFRFLLSYSLPLSNRRRSDAGAKAIKQLKIFRTNVLYVSLDLNDNMWHMRNGINMMVYFKPSE